MTPTIEQQREIACYLWLSPYHPETWPVETIDRLVALRQRDELAFLLAAQSIQRVALQGSGDAT